MNQKQIVDVVLIDASGNEIKIGSAEIEIKLIPETCVSEKRKT